MSYHFWQRKKMKNIFATLGVTTRSLKFIARTPCGACSALFWENPTQYKVFFISPNENIFPLLFVIKMNFKSRERLEQSGIRFFDELRFKKLIALSCRSDERRELGINFLTEIKTKFKMKLKSDLTFFWPEQEFGEKWN